MHFTTFQNTVPEQQLNKQDQKWISALTVLKQFCKGTQ